MNHDLVSVLVPCYNAAPFLPKLLDSLLSQTCPRLELILVNDGSTDATPQVISQYLPRLRSRGFIVKLVDQENRGVAAAINAGLKRFTGAFLTWPDPDDWLTPTSLEERVAVLQTYPNAGLLRCNAQRIDGVTGQILGFFTDNTGRLFEHKTLFRQLLHLETYFAPVCYLVRSSHFRTVSPDLSIYASPRVCQNLQMLLPITHAFPSLQLDSSLAFYLVRPNSRSRSGGTLEDAFKWELAMWEATKHTLSRMRSCDASIARSTARYYVRHRLLPAAFRARMKDEAIGLLSETCLPGWTVTVAALLIHTTCRKSWMRNQSQFAKFRSRLLNRVFSEVIRSSQ